MAIGAPDCDEGVPARRGRRCPGARARVGARGSTSIGRRRAAPLRDDLAIDERGAVPLGASVATALFVSSIPPFRPMAPGRWSASLRRRLGHGGRRERRRTTTCSSPQQFALALTCSPERGCSFRATGAWPPFPLGYDPRTRSVLGPSPTESLHEARGGGGALRAHLLERASPASLVTVGDGHRRAGGGACR